jgi:endonuclease/exonuclease/phosphatase family metal-dependent hydrolase
MPTSTAPLRSHRAWTVVLLCAAMLACGHSSSRGPASPDVVETFRLRVLTWNVHHGYSSAKKHVNRAQLDLVASLSPDVVAFQELAEWDNDMPALYRDGLTSRTGRPWTMHYEADIPHAPRNRRQGSALATWLPIEDERITHVGDRGAPDDQVRNRTTVLLRVRVAGEAVAVATTHLDHLDTANRRVQLDQVQAFLSGAGRFRIVAGDFNADPDDLQTFGTWQREYRDAWMSSVNTLSGSPGYTVALRTQTKRPGRVDYQWYAGLEPLRVQLVETDLSDHHGVLVEWGAPR